MICGLDVKIVTLKQVQKVISKHIYNIDTKEWYISDVTNVVIKHLKSKILKNTCRKMCIKTVEKSPTNATNVVSQHPWGLTYKFT